MQNLNTKQDNSKSRLHFSGFYSTYIFSCIFDLLSCDSLFGQWVILVVRPQLVIAAQLLILESNQVHETLSHCSAHAAQGVPSSRPVLIRSQYLVVLRVRLSLNNSNHESQRMSTEFKFHINNTHDGIQYGSVLCSQWSITQ